MSLEFLVTSLIVVLLPGTGVIYTIAIGLGRGFSAAIAAAFGCTLGILPAALASTLGLAAILHTSALAFQIIKYLGAAYLFYMAWGILNDTSSTDIEPSKKQNSYLKIAATGTLINVLNPKLSLFFLAFLPQFITNSGTSSIAQMISLASIFMGLTLVIFIGYGAAASSARQYVIQRPIVMRWFRRSFAATFGLLGLRLAFAER